MEAFLGVFENLARLSIYADFMDDPAALNVEVTA
jgi:hypothetical protein